MVKYIVKTMSVEEAVDIMRQAGIKSSPERVKLGIQQGVYTWGDCIQMNAPSCTVYSKLFFKWLEERGEEVDKLGWEEEGKRKSPIRTGTPKQGSMRKYPR